MRLEDQTVPPDGAWVQWVKLIVPAAFLAAIALGWNIVRPAITRLLFYFLRHEDGQLYFQKYFGETMGSVNVELATTASAVRTLQNRFEDFARTQTRTDLRIGELASRFETVVERFDASIDRLALALAKIDGATEERRYTATNHPRRRDGDR
jgi:hypothetical protein